MAATRNAVGQALARLIHPVTVGASILLLVNDHVLKPQYGNVITGKLSDFAGLAVAPSIAATALAIGWPHLRPATLVLASVVVTAAGFAAVKTTGTGADLASQVWTAIAGPSVVREDATDLAALPALAIAAWTGVRTRHSRPITAGSMSVARVTCASAVAVFSVVATSDTFPRSCSKTRP